MCLLASANGSQLRQKLKFPFDQKKIHAARDDLQRSIATLNLALAADAAVSDTTDDSTATRRPHRSKQPTVERVEDATPVSPGHGPDSRLLQEGPSERASNAQEYPWRLGRAETIDTTTAEALGSRRREDTVTSIPETHLAPVAQESRHAGSRHSADSLRSHHTKSSFASSGSAAVGTPLTIVPASPRDSIFPKEYSLSTARTTPAEGDEPSIHESEEQVPIDAEYRTEIEERLAEVSRDKCVERPFSLLARLNIEGLVRRLASRVVASGVHTIFPLRLCTVASADMPSHSISFSRSSCPQSSLKKRNQ